MEGQAAPECKPYERRWRDWAIDRNLSNDWMERLNALETLHLVSICEGHLDARPISLRRGPSIILGFQKEYVRPLTEQWYDLKKDLAATMESIWTDEDTAIEFEVQHRINRNIEGWENNDDIFLRVVSRHQRNTDYFPEWANDWFQQSVSRIETFSHFLKNFMGIKGLRR